MSDETPEPGMVKETITKPDGRYLIYYTFVDNAVAGDNAVADDNADDRTVSP